MAAISLQAAAVFQESGGVVLVEAEHYDSRTNDPDGHRWQVVPDEGAGVRTYTNARNGAYIQSLPDSGQNQNVFGDHEVPPLITYKVRIATAGEYRLWLRWSGFDGSSDSLYASIVEVPSPAWYRYVKNSGTDLNAGGWNGDAGLEVNDGGGGEVPATFTLSAGTYTIRLGQREDGSVVDAILLQLTSLADPTSPGPAESTLVEGFLLGSQPANQVATPGGSATFVVSALVPAGATVTYQWERKAPGETAFTSIPQATSASFNTGTVTEAMGGTQYRVLVTSGGTTLTSTAATLTTDATAPTIVGAFGGVNRNNVTIRFSEPITQATAQATANYVINGLTVSSATLQANGTDVVLATSTQTANTPYTITINGLKDVAGNTLTGGTATFTGATQARGGLRVDLWRNIPTTSVDELLADARYPNSPDETFFWGSFGPIGAGNPYGDNYGGQASGWIVAPVSGDYKFYLRSDDASRLFLSTDGTAANEQLIAEQAGCCNAFVDQEGTLSSFPVTLTAGQKYWVRALWKEGGGDDYLQVGWRTPNDANLTTPPTGPIPGQFLETIADPSATINITQQPANVTVAASSPASFTVGFTAFSAFGTNALIQWQKAPAGSTTFVDIPGATSATLTIPFASPADAGSQYRAVITAVNTSVNSNPATLTVTGESTPPSVTAVSGTPTKVTILFSEPIEATAAANKANYTISGGVTVNSATLASAAGQAGVVVLDVSGAVPGTSYTVTINNIRDLSNNLMASTQRSFTAYHIFSNFNDGQVPADAAIYGTTAIQPNGGPDGSGRVALTMNVGSQQGSLVYGDVLSGAEVNRFTARFKLYIGQGSGNPADGFSFNIANDLPQGSFGEEGAGSGLSIVFDTYDNGGAEAPAIDVKVAGAEVATTKVAKAILVNNRWVDVLIQVDATGKLTVFHDNVKYYDALDIGWTPIAGAQIGLGARTGGETAIHAVDDLSVLYNADVPLPQPPTISITAPAEGATLTAGSTINITVNAADPQNQISKVEFFANGNKIGESTTAPYSFSIPNAPGGIFSLTAKVTDAEDLAVTSAAVNVTVRPGAAAEDVLFVHGGAAPNPSDIGVINRLFERGFDVYPVNDTASADTDAAGKVLVVISSTVGSGNVNTKFTTVAVPVINWEQALQDDLQMTTNEDAVTRGGTGSQTQLDIADPTHQMAAGLSGTVVVATSPTTFDWGVPNANAQVVARIAGSPTRAGIYGYNTGAALIDGSPAPARRVMLFLENNTYLALNADGRKLVDAAVDWALGRGGQLPAPQLSLSRAGNQLTITWTNGGMLEAAPTVLGPWNPTGDSDGSFTTSTSETMQFFRVKR